MQIISQELIRIKIKQLMDQYGTSKEKIGEVLKGEKDDGKVRNRHREQQFFFNQKKNINIEQINNLARFYKVPASYFLLDDQDFELLTKINHLGDSERNLAIEMIKKIS